MVISQRWKPRIYGCHSKAAFKRLHLNYNVIQGNMPGYEICEATWRKRFLLGGPIKVEMLPSIGMHAKRM
jgi:hypothetical protein